MVVGQSVKGEAHYWAGRGLTLCYTGSHHYNSLLVEESVKEERPMEQDGSSPDDLANLVPLCHSSVTAPTV